MKGYRIPIWNGILEEKHIKQIGSAIWLFLWLIDKTTREKDGDGKVLGGMPVKTEIINLPFSIKQKLRWIENLEEYGYISTKRAPYGLIITVKKSKKWSERVDKNVLSDKTKMSFLMDKNVHSNKDNTIDNTIRHNTFPLTGKKKKMEYIKDEDTMTIQEYRAYQKKNAGQGKKPEIEAVLHWAEERMGHKFLNRVNQSIIVAKMMKANYTADTIRAKWEELERDDYWASKGIDFGTVLNQIGKHKVVRSTTTKI